MRFEFEEKLKLFPLHVTENETRCFFLIFENDTLRVHFIRPMFSCEYTYVLTESKPHESTNYTGI